MIIDLTCYPAGDLEPSRTKDESLDVLCRVLASHAPQGWPMVRLLSVAGGLIRAADFPSAVLLFVFTTGGPMMPEIPKVEDLASGKVAWRNFSLIWDAPCMRLMIVEVDKG